MLPGSTHTGKGSKELEENETQTVNQSIHTRKKGERGIWLFHAQGNGDERGTADGRG
jgi:hypothetical protein